jgi:hypothetical protein
MSRTNRIDYIMSRIGNMRGCWMSRKLRDQQNRIKNELNCKNEEQDMMKNEKI